MRRTLSPDTATTKALRVLVDTIRPPQEIAHDYGRAFTYLKGELQTRQAEGLEGKIARKHGRLSLLVYRVDQVPTRDQTRGTCQVCGGDQATNGERIVLHGYKRPGQGYTVGRCFGARERALEFDATITQRLFDTETLSLAASRDLAPSLELERSAAEEAWIAGGRDVCPHWSFRGNGEERAAQYAAWLEEHPLAKAHLAAVDRCADNGRAISSAEMWVKHFGALLVSPVRGQPLRIVKV